jgi:hypothetical protein
MTIDLLKIADLVVQVRCPVCDSPIGTGVRMFRPENSNIKVTVSPNVALFCISRQSIQNHLDTHTDEELEAAVRERAAVAEAWPYATDE